MPTTTTATTTTVTGIAHCVPDLEPSLVPSFGSHVVRFADVSFIGGLGEHERWLTEALALVHRAKQEQAR